MVYSVHFDTIVCGAGHAGCEAALAASRIGAKTLLITGNLDTIAKMSCNPSIGGLAKGNIVREIDALGGEMAINADATAIQFRVLNRSKGDAVQGPRAQCDKELYSARMKQVLLKQTTSNLTILQGIVTSIITKNGIIIGVNTDIGTSFFGKTVVLTNGTFLNGIIHIGNNVIKGGRLGDFSSRTLSDSLREHGVEIGRMKTGTPPRILKNSIDFSICEEQSGDQNPCLFAFYDTRDDEIYNKMFRTPYAGDIINGALLNHGFSGQQSCWITHTTLETKHIINNNLDKSPLFSGIIKGTGPRYCPSIEDKFVKFPSHEVHHIFLEPEGYNSDEWYINGLSSSMPFNIQIACIHSVPALRNAKILRPAYAVEYDFAVPTQLDKTLQSKIIENLFCAGQINGTSGYEEAAGQGLIAGINAARKALNQDMLILGRQDAYIGVLIDDLVTKGTSEPYRMFTSRAEHRLLLNHGSSDIRLIEFADKFGLLNAKRIKKTYEKKEKIQKLTEQLSHEEFCKKTLSEWIMQWKNYDTLPFPDEFNTATQSIKNEVIYRIRYSGYLEREYRQAKKIAEWDNVKIPHNFDYALIKSLSNESRQKLQTVRPLTLGQASRISGITPVDIALLQVTLDKQRLK